MDFFWLVEIGWGLTFGTTICRTVFWIFEILNINRTKNELSVFFIFQFFFLYTSQNYSNTEKNDDL